MIQQDDCPRRLPKKLPNGATTVVNLPCNKWTCPTCFPRLLDAEVDKLTEAVPVNVQGVSVVLRADAAVMDVWNLFKNRLRRKYPASYTYAVRHRDSDGDTHMHAAIFGTNITTLQFLWFDVGGTFYNARVIHGVDNLRHFITYALSPRRQGAAIQTATSSSWPTRKKTGNHTAPTVQPVADAAPVPGATEKPAVNPERADDLTTGIVRSVGPITNDQRNQILQQLFDMSVNPAEFRLFDQRLEAAKLLLSNTKETKP